MAASRNIIIIIALVLLRGLEGYVISEFGEAPESQSNCEITPPCAFAVSSVASSFALLIYFNNTVEYYNMAFGQRTTSGFEQLAKSAQQPGSQAFRAEALPRYVLATYVLA